MPDLFRSNVSNFVVGNKSIEPDLYQSIMAKVCVPDLFHSIVANFVVCSKSIVPDLFHSTMSNFVVSYNSVCA